MSCQQDRKKYSPRFKISFYFTVSIFLILNIDLHVIDIPEILQDKPQTTVMREATAKKNFQEDLVVKTQNITIYLLSLQILYYTPPPRINREFIMMIIIMYQVLYQ